MVVQLAKNIYWVGVVDWNLRHFHGYELSTHRGSSYNAYLILDRDLTLVDTVWTPFQEELIENIRELIDPSKIRYVVANHSEADHSGALPRVMEFAQDATVIVSTNGLKSIPGHYHKDWKFQAVKTEDRINIGENDLVFVEAPMLHWPDSMFTYLPKPAILMPNDAFGQHYATAYRYNDQVNQNELYEEAQKYYANILTPFSRLVLQKIEEVLAMKLPVNMICPSHGVIWRKDPLQIVTQYQKWAAQDAQPRAVVVFDTMWQATRKMAEAIGEGLADGGVDHKLFHMAVTDRNDVISEVLISKAVLIGSPTVNMGVLPTIAPFLEDLVHLRFQNKMGAAFGSYGWSGESVERIEDCLKKAKIDIIHEALRCNWQPGDADLEACIQFGKEVAKKIIS